jgi:hypothetical protein
MPASPPKRSKTSRLAAPITVVRRDRRSDLPGDRMSWISVIAAAYSSICFGRYSASLKNAFFRIA